MTTGSVNPNAGRAGVRFVQQRTLKNRISCQGVGLHSGKPVQLELRPGPVGSGIVFRRTDVDADKASIPASWDNVVDTRLCSTLGNEFDVRVSTVEHLMAALSGCGVDNALIEIDGPEVPIMDGSSGPFVDMIETIGLVEQAEPRRIIRILKSIEVRIGDAKAVLKPADRCSLDVEIDFKGTAVEEQSLNVGLVNGVFRKELASARTFGFLHEVEAMQAAGLARGGSLENAIVVDGGKIVNEGGLRFDDEFVRHKILDAVGDLYLAGALIVGSFSAARCGHAINNMLLRALFADKDAWCYDVISGDDMKNAVDGGIWAERVISAGAA